MLPILVLILVAAATSQKDVMPRFLGSHVSQKHDYPYVASIRTYPSNNHFCVGNIIANKWVLSAAQCFEEPNKKPADIVVYAGTLYSNGTEGTSSRVLKIIIHPDFSKQNNTIALLKLKNSLYWWIQTLYAAKVKPIKIGAITDKVSVAKIVGWGSANATDPEKIEELLNWKLYTTLVEEEGGCVNSMDVICGLPVGGGGFCNYDAGAPLISNNGKRDLLVGVVSNIPNSTCGNGKAQPFTRMESFVFWIKQETGKDLSV